MDVAPSRAGTMRAAPAHMAAGLIAASIAAGCDDRERPGFIADPAIEASDRIVSGSFRAPAEGTSGGPPTLADAGALTASAGSGGEGGVGGAGSAADSGSASAAASAPVTLQQVYEGTCEGATVQWGFFTYQALTPGDSSIAFRVRTAAEEATLGDAAYLDLLTASAALGTDRCGFTGPAPCPIDLFALLEGAPLAHHPFAELQVLLRPDSADGRTPAVEQWQLTFSCTFNQ